MFVQLSLSIPFDTKNAMIGSARHTSKESHLYAVLTTS